jgi:AcrR family transcriptional regulator
MGSLQLVTGKGVPGSIRKGGSGSTTGAPAPGSRVPSPLEMAITTPSRPRRADAERNRSRILAAASELFAQRGLDASMPELAERAGVGVGTLYRAFPDKDHLLGAVMAERLRWLAGEIEVAIRADDPWAAFTDVIWKGATLHVKDRAFHQCMRGALELPEVREARSHTLDAFQRLIERAQAAGAMRADVVAEDIPMLMAGVGLSRVAGPGAAWERHLAVVIDGLRAEGAHPLPSKPLSRAQLDAIVRELPCPR